MVKTKDSRPCDGELPLHIGVCDFIGRAETPTKGVHKGRLANPRDCGVHKIVRVNYHRILLRFRSF